ncbi:hypothetical protein OQA88_5729 [Cercophora sp. LCS_1]
MYNYGPPPSAPPPPAPTSGSNGRGRNHNSQSPASHHRGYGGRGRGASDRGGYGNYHQGHHNHATAYGYGQQHPAPAAYGQPSAPTYQAPPQHGPYQPANQYWPQDPAHHAATQHVANHQATQQHNVPQHNVQQHHATQANHSPLPASGYHPNYRQMYEAPSSYNAQPAYPQAHTDQTYGTAGYQPTTQHAPPTTVQQWGAHQTQPAYGSDRNGQEQAIPPPPPAHAGYHNYQQMSSAPTAPYPAAHYGPAPGPYQPPVAQYHAPGAPAFPGHHGNGPRQPYRGGYRDSNRSRGHYHRGNGAHGRHNVARGASNAAASSSSTANQQRSDSTSAGKKKKRRTNPTTNTLGLTPAAVDENSDEFTEDEKVLEAMYGFEAPHPPDIAAWLAERKAKYPTRARIEAANPSGASETTTIEAGAPTSVSTTASTEAVASTGNGESSRTGETRLEQKADRLRKELQKVESTIKRKRDQGDDGDDLRDSDLNSSPSATSSPSDNEQPETMSSAQQVAQAVPPPPQRADPSKHCKYFSTGGVCGKRGKCRFVHDNDVRAAAIAARDENGGRMTITQRLTLNDKEQEDLTILKTLKYLQDTGVLKREITVGAQAIAAESPATPAGSTPVVSTPTALPEAANAGAPSSTAEVSTSAEANAISSSVRTRHDDGIDSLPLGSSLRSLPVNHQGLPPRPPPSSVPHDQNQLYPGWNMGGFGGTGVRPADKK